MEQAKRGPLTPSEKLFHGAKGLLRLEPLLEIHRQGLEIGNGLPPNERARHAREVAASDSVGNLARFIQAETSPDIKALLCSGFVRSFGARYSTLHGVACNSESGMGAIFGFQRRDEFMNHSIGLVKDLFSAGAIELGTLRQMVIDMESEARAARHPSP